MARYQRALALKPDDAEAHNNLGIRAHGEGELGDAVAHYQRALALKPDYAEAHNNLGTVLRAQGNFAAAVVQLPARAHPQARLCRGPQQSGQHAQRPGQA